MRGLLAISFYLMVRLAVGQTLIIDRSKNQPVFPYDRGFAGISIFVDTLVKEGFKIQVNYKPLNKMLPSYTEFQNSILLLTPTVFNPFSPAEVNEIRSYVAKGGKLLIVAEHENFFDHGLNFNQLLRGTPFTIQYNAIRVPSGNFIEAGWPTVTSTKIRGNFRYFLPAGIMLADSSKCLCITQSDATPAPSCVTGLTDFGYGKIAIITDYELFWNMTPTTGIRHADNLKLCKQIIHLLQTPLPASTQAVKNKSNKTAKIRIAVDKDTHYLKFNHDTFKEQLLSHDIELHFTDIAHANPANYAAVVSCSEFKDSTDLSHYLKFRKILILREGKTDFIGLTLNSLEKLKKEVSAELIDKQVKQFIKTLNYQPDSADATLLQKLGITANPGILTNKMLNNPEITLKSDTIESDIELRYSGYWKSFDTTYQTIISYRSIYLPALYTAPPNPKAEFLLNEVGEEKTYSIMIANQKIMALSTASALSNDLYCREIGDLIANWLKK
jgi:hypothetical protein